MKKRLPLLPYLEGKELQLSTSSRLDWVESSFEKQGGVDQVSQEFLGVSVRRRTIGLFFLTMVVVVGSVFAKTAYLQTVQGALMASKAESNKVRLVTVPAMRGVMYDRQHQLLASNAAHFSLTITPADLPRDTFARDALFTTLGTLSGQTPDQIKTFIHNPSSYEPVELMEGFSYEKAMELAVSTAAMPGVSLVANAQRSYDYHQALSLAHVIGYTGTVSQKDLVEKPDVYISKDQTGKVGIERSYDQYLRGTHGEQYVEVDAVGRVQNVIAATPAHNGDNLILSIDVALQKVAQDALQKVLDTLHRTKGVVIISRPSTGEILAMVNLPAFDGNLFAQGISTADYEKLSKDENQPLYTRAISGEYPAGSTVKPLVALAALEEGIVTPNTTVHSTGGLHIGQWFYPDWKPAGHGITNIYKAIAESVNTYFYTISGGFEDVKGLGVDRLKKYYEQLGLGKASGIDIPGESNGFVPSPDWKEKVKGEPWYIGDTYHLGIGQGDLLATPLQIHMTSAYFANGGYNVTPHVVLATESGDTKERHDLAFSRHVEGIGSQKNITVVRDALHQTVLSSTGSGRMLQSLPVSAAGKTGTAQGTVGKDPHAWFSGWAPFDKPEIAITVLVEQGEDGTLPAVQITRSILSWYFGTDGAKSRVDNSLDVKP